MRKNLWIALFITTLIGLSMSGETLASSTGGSKSCMTCLCAQNKPTDCAACCQPQALLCRPFCKQRCKKLCPDPNPNVKTTSQP